ncbi:MAG: type 4a pilus biogenesis protein PilO [Candidatus Acidiferrales bacterium]|jgi:type IV pilus assembly protein PilO
MATPFRDWPLPLQAVFYLGLAVVIVILGLWVPGFPNQRVRADLEAAKTQLKPLENEVANLRVYQQRRVELQGEMDALQKQLATLQTIVPEDKQVDQFIIMLQTAASTSGVSLRRITTKPVVSKDYHFEMPFDLEADGPYYSMLDFFGKLSRLSRIINVGDLRFDALAQNGGATKFPVTPGTSVTGTMTVTTFFTEPGQQQAAATQPVKR